MTLGTEICLYAKNNTIDRLGYIEGQTILFVLDVRSLLILTFSRAIPLAEVSLYYTQHGVCFSRWAVLNKFLWKRHSSYYLHSLVDEQQRYLKESLSHAAQLLFER